MLKQNIQEEAKKMSKTIPVVEATNVTKTYMLGKVPVQALRGVNLKVETGEFVAILGPSGSGKSTMLNLIGALDKPTSGTLLIDGVDISKLTDNQLAELRLKIGFVFQFFNLIPRLTAKDNVELSMAIANTSKTERKQHAIACHEVFQSPDRSQWEGISRCNRTAASGIPIAACSFRTCVGP